MNGGGGGGIPDHILKQILKQQEERKAKQNQFYWSILYLALSYVFLQYVLPWFWSKYRSYMEREEMLKALEHELRLRREAEAELQQRREAVAELEGIVDELSRVSTPAVAALDQKKGASREGAFVLTPPSAPVTLAELQRVRPVDKENKKGSIPSVVSCPSEAHTSSLRNTLRRRTGGQVVTSDPVSNPVPSTPTTTTAVTSLGSSQNPWAQFTTEDVTVGAAAAESESRRRGDEATTQAAERERLRDRQIRNQQDRDLAASEAADRLKAEQAAALELLRVKIERERQQREKDMAEEAVALLERSKETEREEEGRRRGRIDRFYRQIRETRAILPSEPEPRMSEGPSQESSEKGADDLLSGASPMASSHALASPSKPGSLESPSALDLMMVPNALLFGVTLGQINLFSSQEMAEDLSPSPRASAQSGGTVSVSFRFSETKRVDRRFRLTDSDTSLVQFIESSDAYLEAIGLPSLEDFVLSNEVLLRHPMFSEAGKTPPVPVINVGFPRRDITQTGKPIGDISELCEGGGCVVHVRVVQD